MWAICIAQLAWNQDFAGSGLKKVSLSGWHRAPPSPYPGIFCEQVPCFEYFAQDAKGQNPQLPQLQYFTRID
jgi:hypothetical protein